MWLVVDREVARMGTTLPQSLGCPDLQDPRIPVRVSRVVMNPTARRSPIPSNPINARAIDMGIIGNDDVGHLALLGLPGPLSNPFPLWNMMESQTPNRIIGSSGRVKPTCEMERLEDDEGYSCCHTT